MEPVETARSVGSAGRAGRSGSLGGFTKPERLWTLWGRGRGASGVRACGAAGGGWADRPRAISRRRCRRRRSHRSEEAALLAKQTVAPGGWARIWPRKSAKKSAKKREKQSGKKSDLWPVGHGKSKKKVTKKVTFGRSAKEKLKKKK